MADRSHETLKVKVWRGTTTGSFLSYEVPSLENQTVLDIVTYIQQHLDPTLTYRFSCRVGMCGSCAMMVNDEPRWTCRTHVNKVNDNGQLTIAPLRNLPVVKDLATDMDPFFDKWTKAEAHHHPSRNRQESIARIDPTQADRVEADEAIECINCAICYAACDTVSQRSDYLGPAALQRAWTLINDERDGNHATILDAVSEASGCHNCHSMGQCSHYCPNGLEPMKAIAGLKRHTALRWLKG